MAHHHQIKVTILECPDVPLDAILTLEMADHDGIPVQEMTLSLVPEAHVTAFCSMLTHAYGVSFVQEITGEQFDLYYIGLNGNYYQFYSHPNK